jgi:Asp-tRNA(Asn)/Glu-tRNA(Gln) amidotransferase A subunit family amidase
MVDLDLSYTPAAELARLVAAGELSPVEIVANALDRIAVVNAALNCFCASYGDDALAEARTAADAVARGDELGPLHGVPVAIKDTTPQRGRRTTLGSYTHEHWVPEHDAAMVTSLQRAGAIIVGKTTSPEFAHTLITDSPLWGVTRNPWDPTRTTGGSSGGSGAAVASGCVPLAEGSDMGGSVRIPAAWCGLVGLKPGLGRIPMDVLPGNFDSISHHGPLARTTDDARLFLRATQGPNDCDIQSVTTPLDLSAPLTGEVRGLRLGLSVDLGCWAVDTEIEAAVRAAADAWREAGAVVEEVEVGLDARAEGMWMELWGVFMAAYYGHLVEEFHDRMDPDVLRLIALGNSLSAVQLKRIEIERTGVWRKVAAVLADHDALICPTMAQGPLPAAKIDAAEPTVANPDDGRYHSPDLTSVFNLVAPCPVLSLPAGHHGDGLPIGVQVVGRRWQDDTVLRIGRALELARPWADRRPPV